MWGMSVMHWVIVAGVVSVLFGRNKISSVMKDLGGGLREFKKGMSEALDAPRLEDKSDE
jgi:sec-independent protein translocase protein TatA